MSAIYDLMRRMERGRLEKGDTHLLADADTELTRMRETLELASSVAQALLKAARSRTDPVYLCEGDVSALTRLRYAADQALGKTTTTTTGAPHA